MVIYLHLDYFIGKVTSGWEIGEFEEVFNFSVKIGPDAPNSYVILSSKPEGAVDIYENTYEQKADGTQLNGYKTRCVPIVSHRVQVNGILTNR